MWRKKTPKKICVFKVIPGTPMGMHFKGEEGKVQHYILLWCTPTWPSRICST